MMREALTVQIHVLIDNVADSVSSTPDFVQAEWDALRAAGMTVIKGSCQCCANHGLSLFVTAEFQGDQRAVLFDAGPAEETLAYNVKRLGLDLGRVEAVILSHGHWDHAGGLLKALEMIRSERPASEPTPCLLHPGMFHQRAIPRPMGGFLPIQPIVTPSELAQAGARPIVTTDPQELCDRAFYVSGEIQRTTTFEKGFRGHLRRSDDGSSWIPDPLIMDERYLAIVIRGRGVLVISACSHAGIVNVVRDAQLRFAGQRVFAIVGGFHLSGGAERTIAATIDALAEFELQLIAPSHCTGWRAVAALAARFGDSRVVPTAVGQILTLSSREVADPSKDR